MRENVKKKGFTLIELLAVIVILAIIVLIAAPVILNIIQRVRKSAFERSVENVIKAGNIKTLEEQMTYESEDIRFECDNNECISSMLDEEGNNKKLDISGSVGKGYVLVYKNGDIELALEGSGYCAVKSKDVSKVGYTKGTCDDVKKSDTTEPIITSMGLTNTTNSIKVIVSAYDNESGIRKYKYELSGVKSGVKETTENIYTFENLEVGAYTVKVTVYNGNDLVKEENKDITLKPVCPLPVITVSNKDEWTQSKTVTIDYGSVNGCTGKYSLDGGNYIEENTIIINENNKTIYAVNEGGSNSALSQETITKIDVTGPTINITNEQKSAKTIEIEFTSSDSDSKIKEVTCEYGTDENYGNSGTVTVNNKCTIDNLNPNTTYYYKITVNDNALNNTIKTGSIKTLVLLNSAPSDTEGLLGMVYLNPNTGKVCNDYTEENSNTNVYDNKCMKWYVYKDNGNTYDMILDHNAISNVQYNSTGTNSSMKELQTALNELKGSWKVDPRLISVDEIASIIGITSFNGGTSTTSDWFGFNTGTNSRYEMPEGSSKYWWLYEHLDYNTTYGGKNSDTGLYYFYPSLSGSAYSNANYWTSTIVAGTSDYSWAVSAGGHIYGRKVNCSDSIYGGLRPVITISK